MFKILLQILCLGAIELSLLVEYTIFNNVCAVGEYSKEIHKADSANLRNNGGGKQYGEVASRVWGSWGWGDSLIVLYVI